MSLFNLTFVGTKSFGVLFLFFLNNKFYTIMDFFLEMKHVNNIFESWILIFLLFSKIIIIIITHTWMNGCIQ
jgi:hypothetical protein